MKKQTIVVLVAVLVASTVVSFANQPIVDLVWVGGMSPPEAVWTIKPNTPTRNDVIHFTGYTDTVTNIECAEARIGTPTLVINDANQVIEIQFDGDPGAFCWYFWAPVYGFLEGQFGPLADGDWLFFCEHPGSSFSIPFHVSSLKVLDPNGGESLLANSAYTISWADIRGDGNCPGNYLLDYSIDNGENWIPVDSNSVSNTCSYDWLVPVVDSNQCLVRMSDANDASIYDTSDVVFTIYECTLTFDLNHDCFVDFLDFALLATEWLKCGNPFDPNCVQ